MKTFYTVWAIVASLTGVGLLIHLSIVDQKVMYGDKGNPIIGMTISTSYTVMIRIYLSLGLIASAIIPALLSIKTKNPKHQSPSKLSPFESARESKSDKDEFVI